MKIIFCNDMPEFIIINDASEETVENKISELATKHYELVKHSGFGYKSYYEYRKLVYWHVHDVQSGEL